MTERFRLTLAQLNPTVGDLAGNAALARRAWDEARAAGSDMLALTEMFVTGYQTQDLVLRRAFVEEAMATIERLAADCAEGPAIGIGGPCLEDGRLMNAYWVLEGGRVSARVFKHHLPNAEVFDEKRVFSSGEVHGPCRVGPLRIGIPICEDSWHPDVCETLAETGAEILLVPNGSPYHREKLDVRVNLMVTRVVETGLPLVYLNMVGGQDDQVFDGASFVLNPHGRLMAQLPAFEEALVHVDFEGGGRGLAGAARAHRGPARPLGGRLSRDGAVAARLSGQERLFARASGAVGRDRFRSGCSHRRRCAGPRGRALRDAALALHLAGLARGCRGGGPRPRLPSGRGGDRGAAGGGGGGARAALRRHRARHHRGEHPEPPAGPSAHGAVEQVRRDAP